MSGAQKYVTNYSVVLLSGQQGSGKTSMAEQLTKLLSGRFDIFGVKFATPLYKMHNEVREVLASYGADNLEGIDGPLLQLLGTEWGRKTRGEDILVKCAQGIITHQMYRRVDFGVAGKHAIFLFDDCRFPNELTAFDKQKTISIRLVASEECRKARAEKWRPNTGHASEVALDDARFDLVIDTEKNDLAYCVNSARSYIDLRVTQNDQRGWADKEGVNW